jgi:hypothetical protein
VTTLERGYPFHGRHGIRSLLQWREVYTTELLWNGYQEFCRDTNRQQRQTRAELGAMLTLPRHTAGPANGASTSWCGCGTRGWA